MKCSLLQVSLCVNLFISVICERQNPEITTPSGKVLGSLLSSRLNKTIYAFRGIKYAEAPSGNLRFKPPVPIKKWSGVYDATKDGHFCPQPSSPTEHGSEDCLILNVYSTKLPHGTNNPKRPVIVYIHSGGFYSVTSQSNWTGPAYFMDQEIVLVTINYRLGTLGFISTGTEDAPGNNGLKDQVVALKWVKNNIEAFGGDSNGITLFGYSAGGWSIALHMVSPMSRGLFHRAILGSGTPIGQFILPHHQLDLAKRQAQLVGCPDDVSPKRIVECLNKIPAEVLGNSLSGFFGINNDPILVFKPVIEKDFGQERFLSEDPYEIIKRGDFEKIPVVLGITKDEFGAQAYVLDNQTSTKYINENFDTYAPIAFFYERDTPRSKQISAAIRKFYLGEGVINKERSFSGLSKIYQDIVGFPVNRFTNLLAKYNNKPTYYYKFSYQGRYSHAYRPGSNGTIPNGVAHHDDLIYLFYIQTVFPFFDKNFPEREMVEKLTTMWANFAKTGNPIPCSNPLFTGVVWDTYNTNSKKYLDIGKEFSLREKLHEKRYDLWDRLFPLEINN